MSFSTIFYLTKMLEIENSVDFCRPQGLSSLYQVELSLQQRQ